MKKKESVYLSLLVTISIIFAFFCIILNFISDFSNFLNVYVQVSYFKPLANYLFALVTLLLWVVYRQWRKSDTKEKELESIVASINYDTLIVADEKTKIVKVNNSIKKILGYDPKKVLGKKLRSIIGVTQDKVLLDSFFEDERRRQFHKEPIKGQKVDGHPILLEIIIEKIASGNESVTLLKDITQRFKAEKKLREMNEQFRNLARIDTLTGVMNRRGLEERLAIEYEQGKRQGYQISVILIDIDDFKRINDQVGHAAGDALLQEVAKRLLRTLRTTDILARIGGNEFLAALPECRLSEAMLVSERVRLAIASCALPSQEKISKITASMGVAVLPEMLYSIEEILSITRIPLKRSKELGKNRVTRAGGAFYKHSRDLSERTRVSNELMGGKCFYSMGQPIQILSDREVVAWELSCRCTIADLETSDIFYGFSLENNILTSVDLQCLQTNVSTCLAMEKKLDFHFNIYPSTLLATPTENILKILQADKMAGSVCLELSERKFIGSPEYLQESVRALKKAGILIAIDDVSFGRGSLKTLMMLKPDVVKIEQHYSSGIAKDSVKRKTFERMLKMFDNLDVKQIVEGIQTEEDLLVLQEMGVIYGQGDYLGKPAKVKTKE